MSENTYDRVNDFGSVTIQLASPNDIRSWSFGEVKKPETINYRTYRAERDGLFCERIFGPEKDWECSCGKYKGIKHKGVVCERCGVKVTHSRVRRKRMGHINLAAPIAHIWFYKAPPSRLGALLNMKLNHLERTIFLQDYVVVEPGETPLEFKQLLTEEEYRKAKQDHGDRFRAMTGAEALKYLINKLDLATEAQTVRDEYESTSSKARQKELTKRLKIIESLRNSTNKPEWMIMEVIPVIPPDLRPLVLLESGNFATSDLNDLYRRIINRNARLKKLIELNAPEVIIRNEKRMLQQAVDALFDNERQRRPVQGASTRNLKSLTSMIKGKQGRFRENLLGKRVDYSARSVIVVGPELKIHQCGLPKKIALELFQPFIIRRLKELGLADTIKSAKRMLERRDAEVWDVLEEVIHQRPVMLNRAPTLHRMGIQAFEPVLVEGNAIRIHPLVCKGFNADFDGDQMAVHLPLSIEAQVEAHVLMLAPHNIFSPANGQPIITPSQDIVLGTFFMTSELENEKGEFLSFADPKEAMLAYQMGKISLHSRVMVRISNVEKVVQDEAKGPQGLSDVAWVSRDTVRRAKGKPGMGEMRKDFKSRAILTTVGRCIFNDVLPAGVPFYNCALTGKGLSRVIDDTYRILGRAETIKLLDDMKATGFKYATTGGLSFGVTDIREPESKSKIISDGEEQAAKIVKGWRVGQLTDQERRNRLVDVWSHVRQQVLDDLMKCLANDWRDAEGKPAVERAAGARRYLNPIFMMSHSGARGNRDQIRQLGGMRGLMAKPNGDIIEMPIKANFREGLSVLEYFFSTHGARKGLADTALKTADSGYMTRKLADVAQNVVVGEFDCQTVNGVTKSTVYKGESIEVELKDLIIGRSACDTIINPLTDEVIVQRNQIITSAIADRIKGLGIDSVRVRSPLTCESTRGVCGCCYGQDMSTGRPVEAGMAVGIIAAQSIGEPGTQLTMRTFHTGGVATGTQAENDVRSGVAGIVRYRDLSPAELEREGKKVRVVLKRNGEVAICEKDARGNEREIERYKVPYGALLLADDGARVKKGDRLAEWDAHIVPILAEKAGKVSFKDIIENTNVRLDPRAKKLVVIEQRGGNPPTINIESSTGAILDFHALPTKAHIEVENGQVVQAGQALARQPREVKQTADITGGLPRVSELFEARKPKNPAVMAENSGTVEFRDSKRQGKKDIVVRSESGMESVHTVESDEELAVHAGDYVEAGDPLVGGPLVPQDILRIRGPEELQKYLLMEVQKVYRSQGVRINDKHIEVILCQMLRKFRVDNPGDSGFLPGNTVDRFAIREKNRLLVDSVVVEEAGTTSYKVGDVLNKREVKDANDAVAASGGTPAKVRKAKAARARPLLLGITKAALHSESFISAASFQETTRVLADAALEGQVDYLKGLKENVILGHLIPAGTGFPGYLGIQIVKDQPSSGSGPQTAPAAAPDPATVPATA